MKENQKGMTRAELLKGGLIGLTAMATLPLAASCVPESSKQAELEEPEEKFEPGYKEEGSFSPEFHICRGLGVQGDDIWVAGDMAVRRFNKGRKGESFDVPGAAQAVGASPSGKLFATVEDRVIDLSSGKAAAWDSLGPRARLVEIAVTDSEVLVADAGNRCVHRFDHSGRAVGRLGQRDDAAGYVGLIVPSPYLGLALMPDGQVALCNPGQHSIEFHDLEKGLLERHGTVSQSMRDFCGCCNPMALTVLPNGDIVTAEKGIPRVKVVDRQAKFKTVVANSDLFDPKTTGLELAVLGEKVLVLDPWKGGVRTFVPI